MPTTSARTRSRASRSSASRRDGSRPRRRRSRPRWLAGEEAASSGRRCTPPRSTIALRAGDLALAAASAEEVTATAEVFASPGLTATGRRCAGAVALAQGQPVTALAALRAALTAWQELQAPHETACTRVLLSQAYEALGDSDAAARELSAARASFERLGAAPDLCALDGIGGDTHGLSKRELEVLILLATGQTNQEIADGLFLSDRTVARHVSNIFTKLGVSSRSAATAYAYSNGLAGQD